MSEDDYLKNLAKVVGEACDVWLEGRGIAKTSWKKQNDVFFSRHKEMKKRRTL
jgi:hypothetical protein